MMCQFKFKFFRIPTCMTPQQQPLIKEGHPKARKAPIRHNKISFACLFLTILMIVPFLSINGLFANAQPSGNRFDDDEPFEKLVKEEGKEEKIDVSVVAQRPQIKLGKATHLPAMVKVKTTGGARTSSTDIICVIDVSGSMSGEKMELVKKTMMMLIESLSPSDRLSILTFENVGSRITPLKPLKKENIEYFRNHVNQLTPRGGTCIIEGMELAFKTIRDRKIANQATSIFLLSDGQNNCGSERAEESVKKALARPENTDLGVFSIHTFGFGYGHDEDLMNNIALQKDGAFYYIKDLETLDVTFVNAISGIISMISSEMYIHVKTIASDKFSGFNIEKVYGGMWEKLEKNEYKIRVIQLMTEVQKQYVFELNMPAVEGQIDKDHDFIGLVGFMEAKGVNGEQIEQTFHTEFEILDANAQINKDKDNVEVIQSYFRVKTGTAMDQSMKKADQGKYEEARKIIQDMLGQIKENKLVREEKVSILVSQLTELEVRFTRRDYNPQLRKTIVGNSNAITGQNNMLYGSSNQMRGVQNYKMEKKKVSDQNTLQGPSSIAIDHKVLGNSNTLRGHNNGPLRNPQPITGDSNILFGNLNSIPDQNNILRGSYPNFDPQSKNRLSGSSNVANQDPKMSYSNK